MLLYNDKRYYLGNNPCHWLHPPAHVTPDWKGMDDWKYWKFQRGYAQDTIIYHFKDNKISSIED